MKITQAFTFEAAHILPNVPASHKCFRLHGHSYRIELTYEGKVNKKTGFVRDFFEIELLMKPILAKLDHNCLNHVKGLENPTAENIALWLKKLTKAHIVRVYETPMCWAEC